jgi:hypothetical protein
MAAAASRGGAWCPSIADNRGEIGRGVRGIRVSNMKTILRQTFARASLLALLLPALASAQGAPHVRGVVEKLEGSVLTLKLSDGKSETIQLAKDWTVTVLKPVDISAIQPGSFIGTAEIPQSNGTGRSLEVHVFPPGVKAGEGHYAWDLRKGSMMTNGTVGKVTSSPKGQELEVSYPNGQRKLVVPKGVPIVMFSNGDQSLVKPGTPVFLIVAKSPSGELSAGGVAVGENGAKPPM